MALHADAATIRWPAWRRPRGMHPDTCLDGNRDPRRSLSDSSKRQRDLPASCGCRPAASAIASAISRPGPTAAPRKRRPQPRAAGIYALSPQRGAAPPTTFERCHYHARPPRSAREGIFLSARGRDDDVFKFRTPLQNHRTRAVPRWYSCAPTPKISVAQHHATLPLQTEHFPLDCKRMSPVTKKHSSKAIILDKHNPLMSLDASTVRS